jgi:hypothetical protein
MHAIEPLSLVDLDKYPIAELGSERLRPIIVRVREQLADKGCAVLGGFIHSDQQAALADEVAALSGRAFFSRAQVTAYGGVPNEQYPEGHPRRLVLERENGFVAADAIGPDTRLRQLYQSAVLKRFLAQCLQLADIYDFADPLAQLVINVVKPHDKHVWHFDSNEFVVSIMTQPAEDGGEFQYVPNIRAPGNENYGAVQAILEGSLAGVHTIDLRPGDLQLFFGRYSLHRVKPTAGGRDRHTAVLAYSNEPGVLGKAGKTERLYGRKFSAHDAPDNQRTRRDRLID